MVNYSLFSTGRIGRSFLHRLRRQRWQWQSSTFLPSSSSFSFSGQQSFLSNIHSRPSSSSSLIAAKRVLGLDPSDRLTVRELRAAYFQAAKKTHPDVVLLALEEEAASSSAASSTTVATNSGEAFRQVTEAYERLLQSKEVSSFASSNSADSFEISRTEEDEYRAACWAVLGVPAEIVEESKGNPMFRHWLGGNTDGAQHWRAFFAVHGGLAQKLRLPVAYLPSRDESSPSPEAVALETRRKRWKR